MAQQKNKDVLRWISFIVNCIVFPMAYFAIESDWPRVCLYLTFCLFNLFIINELNVKQIDAEDIANIIEARKNA